MQGPGCVLLGTYFLNSQRLPWKGSQQPGEGTEQQSGSSPPPPLTPTHQGLWRAFCGPALLSGLGFLSEHSLCLGPLLDSQERMCLGNPTWSHLPLQCAQHGRVDVQHARSRPRQCMSALTSKTVHEFLALHSCLPQLPSSLTWTPLAAALVGILLPFCPLG